MHTLVVLDQRTFLVPDRHLPPKPWEVGQFLEWEVHPDEARAWQLAKMREGLGRLDRLGEAMGRVMAGERVSVGLPAKAGRVPSEVRRAVEGLRRRGGGAAVREIWDGPAADVLAAAVDKALSTDPPEPPKPTVPEPTSESLYDPPEDDPSSGGT